MELPPKLIYKLLTSEEWRSFQNSASFAGSAVDLKDGFIHFSTAAQLEETKAKHFADQQDLILLAVDPVDVAEHLKFEPSRNGDLFPHLYDTLSINLVRWSVLFDDRQSIE